MPDEAIVTAETAAAVVPPAETTPPVVDPPQWAQQLRQDVVNLAAAVAAIGPASAPAPARTGNAAPTDEELAQAAQLGNWQAQLELQRRTADRAAQQQSAIMQREQAVTGAIAGLVQRFPAFQDAQSPLYAAAVRVRQALVAAGYANTYDTTLEAMKQTIVSDPNLVADHGTVTADAVRRAAVTSHVVPEGTGTRPRAPAGSSTAQPPSTAAERALAARMGLKRTPEEARKRFEERQTQGRSSVSPLIGMILRES